MVEHVEFTIEKWDVPLILTVLQGDYSTPYDHPY